MTEYNIYNTILNSIKKEAGEKGKIKNCVRHRMNRRIRIRRKRIREIYVIFIGTIYRTNPMDHIMYVSVCMRILCNVLFIITSHDYGAAMGKSKKIDSTRERQGRCWRRCCDDNSDDWSMFSFLMEQSPGSQWTHNNDNNKWYGRKRAKKGKCGKGKSMCNRLNVCYSSPYFTTKFNGTHTFYSARFMRIYVVCIRVRG